MQEIPLFIAGEIPKNHDILREAYSLCYRLPVLNTDKFKEDFFNVSIFYRPDNASLTIRFSIRTLKENTFLVLISAISLILFTVYIMLYEGLLKKINLSR